jgi:hypothetical protein
MLFKIGPWNSPARSLTPSVRPGSRYRRPGFNRAGAGSRATLHRLGSSAQLLSRPIRFFK